ncbi:MAG: hypothetical protein ACAF41_12545 [Leptolyngbya sp. BL-A-14]
MTQALIEIRFTGNDISPGYIRSKEIAEIIEAVEEMIASQVISGNPEFRRDAVVVGLSEIRNESLGFQFLLPSLAELTLPAFLEITDSIATGRFNALSKDTIKPLKKVFSFARRHDCNAEIYERNGDRKLLATITPDTELPEVTAISGETTLYGEITRVGGADARNPKIQFKAIDGELIYCNTTKHLAEIAGAKLYQQVGLIGTAKWNAETFEVEEFFVAEISDYEHPSSSAAFRVLSEQFSSAFDSFQDVNRFVKAVRRGDQRE